MLRRNVLGASQWVAIGWICGLCLVTGCATPEFVRLRSVPATPLATSLKLFHKSGPQPTERTLQLLRRHDLLKAAERAPAETLGEFQRLLVENPTPEKMHAFAELAYLAGNRHAERDPEKALGMYVASAMHAYLYLFDERFEPQRNPYDPQYRGACDLYNAALEEMMRLLEQKGDLRPGRQEQIRSQGQVLHLDVVSRSHKWHAADFDEFEFVSDYQLTGLTNHYHGYGLGVPLIAVRRCHPDQDIAERYYPEGLSFPITAYLRLLPNATVGPDGMRHWHVVLEYYDPLEATSLVQHGRQVPLETDLSVPLAFFLNSPQFYRLNTPTLGLIKPSAKIFRQTQGLYMLEPYDPQKIPVLMIHGLWSSPLTWMEAFNDLRASPEIRDHYQFWFYLYPTGQPILQTAQQLRRELAELRHAIDPHRRIPALRQMVLVGHSMGGLISRLQTVESQDLFWRAVSDRSFEEVALDEETRGLLSEVFFFSPDPNVSRVVTIATPHHGSSYANRFTRWLAAKFIQLPGMLVSAQQKLLKTNPDIFRAEGLDRTPTSIDGLAPDSPVLTTMLAAPRAPWTTYHNVIGTEEWIPAGGNLEDTTDGVVSYRSAKVEDAVSELVVTAEHMDVHRHPLAILELRRILLEHLANVWQPAPLGNRAGSDGASLPFLGPRVRPLPATN